MKTLVFLVMMFGLYHIRGVAQATTYGNMSYPYYHTQSRGEAVVVTSDSGFMVAGYNALPSPFYINILLERFNNNGDTIFTKSFDLNQPSTVQVYGANNIFKIKRGYIINGLFNHYDKSYHEDYAKFFISSVDSSGNTLWTKFYGDDSLIASTNYRSSIRTLDGGFALVGWVFDTLSHGPPENMYLVKTDSNGNEIFKSRIKGAYTYATSVAEGKDSSYYLLGALVTGGPPVSNMQITKVDKNGKFKWSKNYGSNSFGWDILKTSDGNILVCGYKTVLTIGLADYYKPRIIKMDTAGNIMWEKLYGDSFSYNTIDYAKILLTTDSNFVIECNIFDTYNPRRNDIMLFKIRPNGDTLWLRRIPRGHIDNIYDIKETPDHGFILCGTKLDSLPDVWLIKTDSMGCDVGGCASTGVTELINESKELKIYPNPNNGNFTLDMTNSNTVDKPHIQLINVLGEIVLDKSVANVNGKIHTKITNNALPTGVYLVKVIVGNQSRVARIAVQK